MEKQQTGSNSQLSSDQFSEFLATLNFMCLGDYENPKSRDYRKALAAFNLFQERKWTVAEFDWVMKEFVKCHRSQYWFPADFLTFHRQNYGSDEMIL